MASSIGDVAVTVGADIDPLKKGLKEGSNSLGRFKKNLMSGAKEAAKYNAALSLVATSGLALIAKETAEAARQTKNLAFISNSSVEVFQKMAFAAESVGIEQEKLSDIFKDFNDRIGDFVSTGGGPMADFFEQIAPKVGVTADQFRRLSGPQALQLYYDSLEKANLAQEDMTFFLEAMASDTTALIPLLQNGGKGFKDLGDQAERFNVILSEQDISELAKADKAFMQIKASIGGAAKQLTLALIPEIGNLKTAVIGVVNELSNIIKNIRKAREETKKNAEAEKEIAKALGVVRNARGRIIKEGNALAIEANNIASRQLELEKLINSEFIKKTGHASRNNKKNREAHERNKIRWAEELEANKIRLEQLQKESEAARKVLEIRNQIKKAEKPIEAKTEEPATPVVDLDEGSRKKKEASELEALKNKYLTEKQLEIMHQEEMLIIGHEYDQKKFDSESEWRSVKEQAEKEHLDKLTKLRRDNMTKAERFSAMSWDNQASHVTGSLVKMTAGVAQQSRKMFKINKAAAIANALVNNYQAVTKTMTALPYPYNVPMAVAQAAAGLAQVNAIRSTSFNGGGAGRSPSSAATEPTAVTNIGGGDGGQQTEPTRIVVEGLEPEQLLTGRAVAALLQEAADNGAILTPA